MKIPFYDLGRVISTYKKELNAAALKVVESAQFINGEEVNRFENSFAKYLGVRSCVGVGNGYDAIKLTLKSWILRNKLEAGDQVLVPSNTFIATALAVKEVGLVPVFASANPETHLLDVGSVEDKLKPEVKAIIPVHLYGQMVNMDAICALAKKHDLLVLEDAAQAQGASWRGKKPGSFGFPAAFSFYPAKNLGALGDAGAIASDDIMLIEHIRQISNYGSKLKYQHSELGVNSRLDEIQAAFLNVRLKYLDEEIMKRQELAQSYLSGISNPRIKLPELIEGGIPAWHLFVIQVDKRHELIEYLSNNGIESMIHYPQDLSENILFGEHKAESNRSNQILSIPIFPNMTAKEQAYIMEKLNSF